MRWALCVGHRTESRAKKAPLSAWRRSIDVWYPHNESLVSTYPRVRFPNAISVNLARPPRSINGGQFPDAASLTRGPLVRRPHRGGTLQCNAIPTRLRSIDLRRGIGAIVMGACVLMSPVALPGRHAVAVEAAQWAGWTIGMVRRSGQPGWIPGLAVINL